VRERESRGDGKMGKRDWESRLSLTGSDSGKMKQKE